MNKKLYKLLDRAKSQALANYREFCKAEKALDKYDCGLELVRQFDLKLVERYEAYSESMRLGLLRCLRIENAIGYCNQ